jgi:hypothetical protein
VQQLECINSGTTSLVECLQALQAEAAQAGIRVLVPGLWEEAGMEERGEGREATLHALGPDGKVTMLLFSAPLLCRRRRRHDMCGRRDLLLMQTSVPMWMECMRYSVSCIRRRRWGCSRQRGHVMKWYRRCKSSCMCRANRIVYRLNSSNASSRRCSSKSAYWMRKI